MLIVVGQEGGGKEGKSLTTLDFQIALQISLLTLETLFLDLLLDLELLFLLCGTETIPDCHGGNPGLARVCSRLLWIDPWTSCAVDFFPMTREQIARSESMVSFS